MYYGHNPKQLWSEWYFDQFSCFATVPTYWADGKNLAGTDYNDCLLIAWSSRFGDPTNLQTELGSTETMVLEDLEVVISTCWWSVGRGKNGEF